MSLTADRNTARAERANVKLLGVAAATKIYGGSIVCRNSAGYAVKGAAALGLRVVGRANEQVDNSAGANGDLTIKVEEGVFLWANSAAGDQIGIADIGNRCFIVDDQTVAKTSGAGTRSPAGRIVGLDAIGNVLVVMGDGETPDRKIYVQARIETLVTGSTYYAVAPAAGRVTGVRSIADAALTTGNAILTPSINGVPITGAVLTLVQAASAAGDTYSAVPTAGNVVSAGDKLSVAVTGTQATAAKAQFYFEITID